MALLQKAQLVDAPITAHWPMFLSAVVALAFDDHQHRRRRRSGAAVRALLAEGTYRNMHDKLASGVYNLTRRELEAREEQK